MDIISCLQDQAQWQQFLSARQEGGHSSPGEEKALAEFIRSGAYLAPCEKAARGESFSPPRKVAISKLHSDKKRIVYIHSPEERNVLKLLTYLLQRKYDHLFAPNLYSFRPGRSVRTAIEDLTRQPGLGSMYSYKVDIQDYFNSIPIRQLLPELKQALQEDPGVYDFLAALLENPSVSQDGTVIEEPNKGIMAGTPVSAFLANFYLRNLDKRFSEAGKLYARYSDDIITFASSSAELEENICWIKDALALGGLTVNPKKESRTAPGEPWIFLGFLFEDGNIDIAPVSLEKLKGKMRRKTRALARWKDRKAATGENAAKAFIRAFNRKLFENPMDHELTWARWYFPMITTAESLKIIDQYSQSCVRYLATGKHTKSAYNFRYEDMKELGYISLVNAYYSHRFHREKAEETVD